MAARAILAGPLKLPVGVALGAADLLMEGEQVLGRMLELDFGERMPGCMAGLAFTIKFRTVGRGMAGGADRLGFLVAVAVVANELGVAAF